MRGFVGGRVSSRVLMLILLLALVIGCGGADDDPAPGTRRVPAMATADPLTTPTAVDFSHAHDPETPVTQADLQSTAEATGCPVSAYTEVDLLEEPQPALAFIDDGITAIPYTWFGGRWYEGPNWVQWQSEIDGNLTFTAEPRDAMSAPILLTNAVAKPYGGFTEIVFDDPGCWDARAIVSGRQLDFTIWVEPFEQRSDMAPILADNEARIPYPVPADCAVTPIDDVNVSLAVRSRDRLVYEVEGDGLSLAGELPLLFAGENVLSWYPDPWASVTVTAELAGSGGAALVTNEIRSTDLSGEHLATTLLFPAEGCWTLHATTEPTATDPASTLSATVYVYPEGCRSEPGHPVPETCVRPQ